MSTGSKNTKIIFGIAVIVVVAVIAVFGIINQRGKNNEDNVVTIGAILPLTGKFADSGNSICGFLKDREKSVPVGVIFISESSAISGK